MDNLRVKASVISFIMLLAFSFWVMQMQNESIQKAAEMSSENAYAENPEEFKKVFDENMQQWNEAEDLLTKGAYWDAFQEHGKAVSLEYNMSGGQNIEITQGKNAMDIFQARKKKFAETSLSAFDKVCANSILKPLDSWKFQEFAHLFLDVNPEIRRLYDAKKKEIIAARIREAGKWMRISFATADKEYLPPVLDRLQEHWTGKYGKTLVTGEILDSREIPATWMVLEVKIDTTGATYEVKSRQYNRIIPVKVPESVKISFNLKKRVQMPTSWDSLPSITAFEQAPSVIHEEYEGITDTIEKVADEQRLKLVEQIAQKLPKFPVFELYPGKKTERLKLFDGAKINREDANILGAIAPEKLNREATELSSSGNQAITAELLKIAIEQDIDSLGKWASEVIASSDENFQTEILKWLEPRPAFGNFAPILSLVRKATTQGQLRQKALEILKPYLHEEKVFQAFTMILTNQDSPDRNSAAAIFFTGLPPDRLKECENWIKDPDPEFVRIIYQALTRNDSPLKDQAFGLMLADSPTDVQMNLLMQFHYQEKTHGTEAIDKLKQVINSSSDEKVKKLALEKMIYDTASTPYGWKTLESMLSKIDDPEMLDKANVSLARYVDRANPDGAIEWQMKSLLSKNREQQLAAAHNFLRKDVDGNLKVLITQLKECLKDDEVFEALLRGMSESGFSKIQNPGSDELRDLLIIAIKHPAKMVRYHAYSLCQRAWNKGAKKFKKVMTEALPSERDDWVKKHGESMLASMK
ncbi:MAG: hypothetical protein ACOYXC_03210 [Candidatus Rifleibacteriota bacterium]